MRIPLGARGFISAGRVAELVIELIQLPKSAGESAFVRASGASGAFEGVKILLAEQFAHLRAVFVDVVEFRVGNQGVDARRVGSGSRRFRAILLAGFAGDVGKAAVGVWRLGE